MGPLVEANRYPKPRLISLVQCTLVEGAKSSYSALSTRSMAGLRGKQTRLKGQESFAAFSNPPAS